MIKLVSFDVFRTLLDIEEHKHRPEAYEQLARYLGYGGAPVTGKALADAIVTVTRQRLDASTARFPDVEIVGVLAAALACLGHLVPRARLTQAAWVLRSATTRLKRVPNADQAIEGLRRHGYRLAICSNTQRAYTIGELRAFGLLDYFDTIVFSSDVGACKPGPEAFARLLQRAGVSAHEIIHVGDSFIDDVKGACGAGLRAIWLDRGFRRESHAPALRRITVGEFPHLAKIIDDLA